MVEASQAGVEIHLYVRGICCLRPGVEGYTENITIRALLGRYLEHSRIFVFGEGERQRIFLGSGDLLNRNTRRRVEIFAEPKSQAVREQLLHILEMLEKDTCQSWLMQPDGTYQRIQQAEGETSVNCQMRLYDYFTKYADPVQPQPRRTQRLQEEKETVERTMQQLRSKEQEQETEEKTGLFKRIWKALFGKRRAK